MPSQNLSSTHNSPVAGTGCMKYSSKGSDQAAMFKLSLFLNATASVYRFLLCCTNPVHSD